ncbi:MAG: hypothetical protein QW680_10010, partial [Pyrobaculum sp.]
LTRIVILSFCSAASPFSQSLYIHFLYPPTAFAIFRSGVYNKAQKRRIPNAILRRAFTSPFYIHINECFKAVTAVVYLYIGLVEF